MSIDTKQVTIFFGTKKPLPNPEIIYETDYDGRSHVVEVRFKYELMPAGKQIIKMDSKSDSSLISIKNLCADLGINYMGHRVD